jgi:hypothetical protein
MKRMTTGPLPRPMRADGASHRRPAAAFTADARTAAGPLIRAVMKYRLLKPACMAVAKGRV